MPRKKTHEEFIEELSHVTDSLKVIGKYNGGHKHIECKCLKCGNVWNPVAGDILKGHGCPKCYEKIRGKSILKTNEQFLNDLKLKNDAVEPLEEYINSSTEILFRCKKCGNEWKSKPNNILNGHGCRKCYEKTIGDRCRNDLDEIKERLNQILPNIKIIGKNYVNNKIPIECECTVCGSKFMKRTDLLLNGRGCKTCAINKRHDIYSMSQEEFVKRVDEMNPDVEVLGEYYNNRTHIKVKCKICGHTWDGDPSLLIYKKSRCCPKCHASTGEKILSNILTDYDIDYEQQFSFKDCVYDSYLRFDAYDLGNNIAYEYQGEQHYIPINFSGKGQEWAENNLKVTQARDDVKRKYCKEHGIPLIEIPYWEKDNMRDFLIDKWKELELDIA